MSSDPFRALGLSPGPGLTDDDVRGAWRRVAEATHPDRADGGDPAAFAAAASAYSDLRTAFARNEALADLTAATGRAAAGRRPGGPAGLLAHWAARVRYGRPRRLALRALAGIAAGTLVVIIAGWQPATPALLVGALTWLIRSGRHDLAATDRHRSAGA
jgi:hypothetical protein